jgi:shikimate kinase
MQNIFLIGYMGAGKTTIGKKLAKRLERPFVDTDRFIENRYHKKVSEIFAEKGEAFFREIEHNVLQEVAQFENTVISTGGGAPCFFDNMDLMNRTGTTVYLKVPVSGLAERLIVCRQKRPLIKDKTMDELERYISMNLNQRETWYNRAAIIFPVEYIGSYKAVDTITEDLIKRINEVET